MRPMPFYFRTLMDFPGRRLELREWAQGGLSTADFPGFFMSLPPRRRRVRPHAILVQLGTNDVLPILEGRTRAEDFEASFRKILNDFRSYRSPVGGRPFLLVATVPLFAERPGNEDKNHCVRAVINPVILKVSREVGAVIVDNFSCLEHKPYLYDPDGVHPNPLGEAALARNWARAVKSALLNRP